VSRAALGILIVLALLNGAAPAALAAKPAARVIHVTAKKFEYAPAVIELKVGEPVVIEITSLDRKHGFSAPELGIDAVIVPGKTARVRFVPDRAGTFVFHCSVFCGSGHEGMTGQIVVST
jgi:cytochrome c oxidase subunit 2